MFADLAGWCRARGVTPWCYLEEIQHPARRREGPAGVAPAPGGRGRLAPNCARAVPQLHFVRRRPVLRSADGAGLVVPRVADDDGGVIRRILEQRTETA
ncbi:MAG: hypothetical protein HY900_35970 [Deltaproteobacteria bacterium]|nr:hypothetical protein [Deltaproteobacteria bacterium]